MFELAPAVVEDKFYSYGAEKNQWNPPSSFFLFTGIFFFANARKWGKWAENGVLHKQRRLRNHKLNSCMNRFLFVSLLGQS